MPAFLYSNVEKDFIPTPWPDFVFECFNGDWAYLFILTQARKYYIDDPLSVYRQGAGIITNSNIITQLINGLKIAKELDKYTKYEYHYYFKKRYINYEKLYLEHKK